MSDPLTTLPAVTGTDTKQTLEFILGALFIVFHSFERFNNPSTNRPSTTAFRYYFAASLYTGIYLVFFAIFTKYPSFLMLIQDSLSGKTAISDILQTVHNLPPALIVALLFTIFIEKLKFLKVIDARLREFLQNNAAIPSEARHLASQLRSAAFQFEQNNTVERIRTRLEEEGIKEADILFSENGKEKTLLSKVTALTLQLETWEQDRRLCRFITEHRGTYDSLSNRYTRLLKKAKICFELNEEEFEKLENPQALVAANECTKAFKEQCRSLFAAQCDFISMAALSCNVMESARQKALSDMGFIIPVNRTRSGLSVNQLTTLMVFFFVISGASYALGSRFLSVDTQQVESTLQSAANGQGVTAEQVNQRKDVKKPKIRFSFLLMIGIIFTVSTACVTYTKGKFGRDENGDRPMLYYILVSLFAIIMTIPVNVIFHTMYILNTDPSQSLKDIISITEESLLKQHWVWKIVVFSSAFSLAFLIDNKPWGKVKPFQWQLIEGAVNAIVITTATISVFMLRSHSGSLFADPHFLNAIIRNGMIGFLIGYLVPTTFRNAAQIPHATIQDATSYIENEEINVTQAGLSANQATELS